ncbi:DEAD/DEAH box helicase [Caulobacter sp. KR2-114]|uniref:DEAD/DEAH box helicase n=1 Tax=Caulobacter sp. KR2-114 TaxID=3400912 RepID=UPI003C10ADAA
MPFPTLNRALERALFAQQYLEPTSVQAAVLETAADGRDLLVSAQTGSGKTVAFGLAMAHEVLGEAERLPPAGAPLALVIAPTRELALQVSRELAWLYAEAGARIATCVGGMDARREQRALADGAHIVVGTPGRLRDHLERAHLQLASIRAAVLDEADEMLDLGFREDLETILDFTPPERRTLLFSATIAPGIAALARRYQKDALRIDTARRNEPHGDIDYRAIRVAPHEVEHAVVNVLRHFEAPGALVFCATREAVRHLHVSLRERGFQVVALSGELSQKDRSEALQALRDGRAQVCVATDVAARGLDLPDLGLVVHAELPQNKAALLHRSGRTGRAGRKGVSVLLVPHSRRRYAERLLDEAHVKVTWSGPPTAEAIRERDQQRLLSDPALAEPASEEELTLARAILAGHAPEQVATALLRLHRARLPAPEELMDDGGYEVRDQRPNNRERRAERQSFTREREGQAGAHPGQGRGAPGGWFRIKVGRRDDADPKWLIPVICRLGHVAKADIGAIRIFERETKFEIAPEALNRFTAAINAQGEAERERIEPAAAPGPRESGPRDGGPREKPAFRGGPKPHRGKPGFKPKRKG